ncbi:MAG: oxidative damage protection protein [Acidobacteriota bacterium]|nr:oxidative damage protection protein [Acidobacteriota bacterium]
MANTVHCSRCGRDAAALPAPPLPGPSGTEIQQKVCADCWAEWQNMEVMVINELRLNFMDPGAQETLDRHMREFFGLVSPEEANSSKLEDLPGLPEQPKPPKQRDGG